MANASNLIHALPAMLLKSILEFFSAQSSPGTVSRIAQAGQGFQADLCAVLDRPASLATVSGYWL